MRKRILNEQDFRKLKGENNTIEHSDVLIRENKDIQQQKFITVEQLQKLLGGGITLNRAYELTHIEGFPCITKGRRRYIVVSLLDKWLEENIGKVFE